MFIKVEVPDGTEYVEIKSYKESGFGELLERRCISTSTLQSMTVKDEPCELCEDGGCVTYVRGLPIPPKEHPYNYCPNCGRLLHCNYDCAICEQARKEKVPFCPNCGRDLRKDVE